MKYTKEQKIKEYEEDVEDYEKTLKQDLQGLEDAKKFIWQSKINLAEAIIKLNNFKNDK